MKDILIKGSQIQRELKILLGCFTFALILNIFSITLYQTRWVEIFTQLHFIVMLAVAVYLLIAFFRLIAYGIRTLRGKKRTQA